MMVLTKSQKETIELGKKIAQGLKGGEIIGLEGDLGAGKTTLIKGLAQGLGLKKAITSPTFLVMRVYQLPVNLGRARSSPRQWLKFLVHVDAYRLKQAQELIDLGVEEYLGKKQSIVLIEWAERVRGLLKNKKVMRIKLDFGKKENERMITIQAISR